MKIQPNILLWLVPVALLVGAIGSWPYAYYMLMRVVVCLMCAGIASYQLSNLRKLEGWTIAMFAIALLFNPIFPVHLRRGIWAVLDAVAAIIIVTDYFMFKKRMAATATP